ALFGSANGKVPCRPLTPTPLPPGERGGGEGAAARLARRRVQRAGSHRATSRGGQPAQPVLSAVLLQIDEPKRVPALGPFSSSTLSGCPRRRNRSWANGDNP